MIVSKGELFAKLGEILDDNEVRFAFAGEELEVENVEIGAGMEEAWINLFPKAESKDETGPWYVGRHRKPDQDFPFLGVTHHTPCEEND